jgi:diguanylate cyclase (GGDEF)-like protein
MERVFDAKARAVTLSASRTGDRLLAPAVLDGNVATVIVPGASKLHALVALEGHRPFAKHELRLAAILADTAGRTLDARDALASTRERVERDPLTGLLNRSALVRDLTLAVQGADSSEESVALMFVDLDGFKVINEELGHAAGDALLVRVGGSIRAAGRDDDRVYRFGGDEFALMLRGVTEEEATVVADRLVKGLSESTAMKEQQKARRLRTRGDSAQDDEPGHRAKCVRPLAHGGTNGCHARGPFGPVPAAGSGNSFLTVA